MESGAVKILERKPTVEDYAVEFGKRIVTARGEMTQSEFLKLLKENGSQITQARLSHYETGRNYPDPPIMMELVNALGVSADWLLGLTKEELPVADLEEKLAAATGEHKINKVMKRLPKERQQEVLRFAEYLLFQENSIDTRQIPTIHPLPMNEVQRMEAAIRAMIKSVRDERGIEAAEEFKRILRSKGVDLDPDA